MTITTRSIKKLIALAFLPLFLCSQAFAATTYAKRWPTDTPVQIAPLSGSLISGNCIKSDANGNIIDSGSACGGSSAPIDATYITQTSNGTLTNEQALSALSSGIMRVATTTGVVTSLTDSAGIAANISDETGSGVLVFATSPTLVTPVLGAATATSINKVALTAPASGSTLTIADGKTLTASNTLTFTGTDSSSVAFGTGGTAAYTGNNLSVFASTTSAQLAGVLSDETGSGLAVFATSPSLTTPVLGSATATAIKVGAGSSASGAAGIFDVSADGANSYLSTIKNTRSASGQNYGLVIVAGSTSGDAAFRVFEKTQTTDMFQIAGDGTITFSNKIVNYNGIATVGNGVPSELATIDSTGLTANVGASTLYAVPASGAGLYRVNAYVVETTAGSVSSTLPNVQIVYTDSDSNTSVTIDATPVFGVAGIGQTGALTANTVGTASSGVIAVYVKASTTIQYQTVNYASTNAGMTYALRIKLEAL